MSRAIKFRAWDKDNEEMILDFGLTPEDQFPYKCPPDDCDSPEDPANFSCWENAELMQFTNKTDHNGIDIYDKDIVQFKHPAPKKTNKRPVINMVVGWEAKNACWALYWQSASGELLWQRLGKVLDDSHTVIGNVYENRDLIS